MLNFNSRIASKMREEAPREAAPLTCARPDCANPLTETPEETGFLCERCSLERDLFDRDARWERIFPVH